jgi:hypothetical protein
MVFCWRESSGLHQAVATTNIQPLQEITEQNERFNPGGLLQWMDLDMMMFLTCLANHRKTALLDADQVNIFSVIGYQNLEDPPYVELRSAIKRLTGTQFWSFKQNEDGSFRYGPLPPILLISDRERQVWVRDGRRLRLVIELGAGWIPEIQEDMQVVDVNAYLYLIRELRRVDAYRRQAGQRREALEAERPPDCTRSILLFLASCRHGNTSMVSIPASWIAERFADRHISIPYANRHMDMVNRASALESRDALEAKSLTDALFAGLPEPRYKFRDVLHERGKIRRALDALVNLKILRGYAVVDGRLTAEFSNQKNLPTIQVDCDGIYWDDQPRRLQSRHLGRQESFLRRGMLTDTVDLTETRQSESGNGDQHGVKEDISLDRIIAFLRRQEGISAEVLAKVISAAVAAASRDPNAGAIDVCTIGMRQVLGPMRCDLMLQLFKLEQDSTAVIPVQTVADEAPMRDDDEDEHSVVKQLAGRIPDLRPSALLRWQQELRGEDRLWMLLAKLLEEEEEILSSGTTLAVRGGSIVKNDPSLADLDVNRVNLAVVRRRVAFIGRLGLPPSKGIAVFLSGIAVANRKARRVEKDNGTVAQDAAVARERILAGCEKLMALAARPWGLNSVQQRDAVAFLGNSGLLGAYYAKEALEGNLSALEKVFRALKQASLLAESAEFCPVLPAQ